MKNAFFLVGGPGSGKDIILKNIFHTQNISEFNIDQIKQSVFYTENMVVVANAYDIEKIRIVKNLLENLYYKTNLIFVDVSTETSKIRSEGRGIDDFVISDKIKTSKQNMEGFQNMFDNFYYFNNDYDKTSEKIIEQICSIYEIVENAVETPLTKFKKKIKKKDTEVSYNPLPAPKDGINQTFDTRSAGNGDLISNYQYESFDPNPLEQGVGFGSTYGNTSKQEPFTTIKVAISGSPQPTTFRRIKNVLFKKKKPDA